MNKSVKNMVKVTLITAAIGVASLGGISAYENTKPINVQYYGEIRGDMQYFKLLTTLREANYGQTVHIYMNSPGGSVIHGNDLAKAMQDSKAHVVYHIGGIAASMAALMACQADVLDIGDSAIIMFHTLQDNNGPIISPSDPGDQAFIKAYHTLIKHCKFITQDEVNEMDAGKEVWLTGEEVKERLTKLGVSQNGQI